MLALQLGRPSGIQDRDIDIELPLNIDVDFTDAKAIFAMQNRQNDLMSDGNQGNEYREGYGSLTSVSAFLGPPKKAHPADDVFHPPHPFKPAQAADPVCHPKFRTSTLY